MPDYGTTYRESIGRIMALVNNQNVHLPVPACPGWAVRDVIAHLCGGLRDISKGDVEHAGEDEWTAKQVADYAHRSVTDIAGEWHLRANTSPSAFQQYGQVMMADIITHEFDIRGAIGNTGGRDLPAVRSAALFYLNALDYVFTEDSIPPLRILTEDKALDLGKGEPQTTVEMGWWEAMRLTSGRRSREQVRALAWSRDPDPWLDHDHLFIFGPRENDLME
jgi:uncharacterized protein (TIGR03083 family)